MQQLLHDFFSSQEIQILLLVIVVDFLLGVISAVKDDAFRLSYVTDFARNDLLFKVLPLLILWGAALYAGSQDLVIPGLDMDAIRWAVYGLVMAAMIASILNSIRGLFPGLPLPNLIAGDDPNSKAPPPDTTSPPKA